MRLRIRSGMPLALFMALLGGCSSSAGRILADGGPPADGASGDDGATGPADFAGTDGGAAGGCQISATDVACAKQMIALPVAGNNRPVFFATPTGAPPAAGWPVVLFFQGSYASGAHAFYATSTDLFGGYYEALTVAKLLNGGYAVVAPESMGVTYWQTNIPPYSTSWPGCADDLFMIKIFSAIADGTFGPLDSTRLHATGISSGGFMTSRMAVSYPGRFRSLAINSGSYATCAGTCTVPTPLPADHPPTLFLHGRQDMIVQLSGMVAYRDALLAQQLIAQSIINDTAGHQFIPEAPDAILGWFVNHP